MTTACYRCHGTGSMEIEGSGGQRTTCTRCVGAGSVAETTRSLLWQGEVGPVTMRVTRIDEELCIEEQGLDDTTWIECQDSDYREEALDRCTRQLHDALLRATKSLDAILRATKGAA